MKRLRPSRVLKIVSGSAEETLALGRELGRHLPVPAIVLLKGLLGSGKTTLTRGIAEGLGLDDGSLVNSPSFTLVNVYHGRCPIYHVDLYRLRGRNDIASVGLDEFMGREGVTIVEWSERLGGTVEAAVTVELGDAGGDSRIVCLSFCDLNLRQQISRTGRSWLV